MSALAERRRHKRYEIELPGRIGPVGAALAECVVRDYCSGGMLIQLLPEEGDAAQPPLSAGQLVELRVELLTPKGARRLRVDAEVAWASEGYIGASFPRSSHGFVSALQQHDRQSRARAVPALHLQQGGGPRHLAKLRHMALGHLPPLLRDLLLKAQGDLLDEADKGASDKDRQQIYTDVTAVEQPGVAERLLEGILHAALEAPPAPPQAEDDSELSLVDPEDFERWLEASRVSNQLQQHFAPQLGELASRLAALHDAAEPAALTVPFEPRHFTEALKELARELQLGKASRAVLFCRAARLFKDRLGAFYGEFDRTLDVLGLPGAAPGQGPKIRQSPRAQRRPGTRDAAARPPHGEALLQGDASQFVLSADLLQAIRAREAEQRENQARELMDYVGEVPNMTASLAAWLDRLNGPLQRAAAADETFFHNARHPLRTIVDGLGHLQMFRRRPDLSPVEDPLQRRVAELLSAIDYEDLDIQALRSVSEALQKLTAEQSRLYQRNVERVVEASEGRDRVRRARATVGDELNKRYAGRRVPALVPELLEVGWRALLELALLGDRGSEGRYAGLLELLDALVAQLGGEAYRDAPPIQPTALLDRLEAELANVAFDPFRRKALEARLRSALAHHEAAPNELVEMAPLPVEGRASDSGKPPSGVNEQAWRHALHRCAALKVGDHLNLLDAPEGSQELRVAWIRPNHELFTLVDYRGLRVRDITLSELALGLHRHRIELNEVDGRSLSDRAVDVMLSRMESRLSHQTAHDSLTGLIGRKQFHGALGKALTVPGRAGDLGVLLWVDLDQFGLVNELYGYDVGDRLLIGVAQLLGQIKGAKVLAHLDSDHFGVLLPDLGLADGERRADAICEAVRNLDFDWPGQGMSLSVSVGVAGLGSGASGVAGLLRAVDAALAQAKADGGGRCYVYHENDPGIAQRTEAAKWLVRVDEALEHGELKLRCQPIVPVRPSEGLAPHFEILLGVHSGGGEALPIAEFIRAAETYNRMRAVDRWVVRSTMDWIARHRGQMPALHGFAVNLSGQTASDPGFVDFVRQQFTRTQIEPAWLSFEITETAAVGDMSRTAGIIRELKAMGCSVALDDFGSGLASYQYLKELPVDWLKIDGAFVRKIAASEEDYAVVKSINEIGHFLGKKTIAEYVADAEILRRVGELGVDFAQGFGISPPLPLDELGRSVQQSAPAPVKKTG